MLHPPSPSPQVVGAFMESGTPEDNEAIKQLALERPSAPAGTTDDAASLALLLAGTKL